MTPRLDVQLTLRRSTSSLRLQAQCACFPLVVLGPSGAGKTSLLECLAGHAQPDAGRILWDGAVLFDRTHRIDVPPEARRMGYVMQDGALFPHLSLRDNVLFGVRRGAPRTAALEHLHELGIAHLARQRPHAVSGGERTRAALARALASDPALLLLDEPFVGLDPATRASTLALLQEVLQRRNLPAILVTHERAEALALGRWTWLLLQGRVAQEGPPRDLLRRPASQEIARFVGTENFLPGRVRTREAGLCQVDCGALLVAVHGDVIPGMEVVVCVRPEDVHLSRERGPGGSARNVMQARVQSVHSEGPFRCVALAGALPLRALVTPRAEEELALRPGTAVVASFKAASAHLLPAADHGGRNR